MARRFALRPCSRRPGDEWGTRWLFPSPGCWTVRATRDAGQQAELTVRVAASGLPTRAPRDVRVAES